MRFSVISLSLFLGLWLLVCIISLFLRVCFSVQSLRFWSTLVCFACIVQFRCRVTDPIFYFCVHDLLRFDLL